MQTNIIDMQTEREKRQADRYANPSAAREIGEALIAGAFIIGAFWLACWILGPNIWKA